MISPYFLKDKKIVACKVVKVPHILTILNIPVSSVILLVKLVEIKILRIVCPVILLCFWKIINARISVNLAFFLKNLIILVNSVVINFQFIDL